MQREPLSSDQQDSSGAQPVQVPAAPLAPETPAAPAAPEPAELPPCPDAPPGVLAAPLVAAVPPPLAAEVPASPFGAPPSPLDPPSFGTPPFEVTPAAPPVTCPPEPPAAAVAAPPSPLVPPVIAGLELEWRLFPQPKGRDASADAVASRIAAAGPRITPGLATAKQSRATAGLTQSAPNWSASRGLGAGVVCKDRLVRDFDRWFVATRTAGARHFATIVAI
jgi:hypothetical protein